jgi:hypothetical protein
MPILAAYAPLCRILSPSPVVLAEILAEQKLGNGFLDSTLESPRCFPL